VRFIDNPSLPRRRESRKHGNFWIPACAGMTKSNHSNQIFMATFLPTFSITSVAWHLLKKLFDYFRIINQ